MERLCLSEQRWVQVAFPETSCLQARSSSVQFQVIHVLLDPGFAGISTDLPALFGLEAVGEGVDRLGSHGTLPKVAISVVCGSCWTALVGRQALPGVVLHRTLCDFILDLVWPLGCPN